MDMIEMKLFELRDKATFIPIFAFRNVIVHWADIRNMTKEDEDLAEKEQYLLRRAGFGPDSSCITIGRLSCSAPVDSECTYDVYAHAHIRTWRVAHDYIETNWDTLKSGDVIDVEFILGETATIKKSEREE